MFPVCLQVLVNLHMGSTLCKNNHEKTEVTHRCVCILIMVVNRCTRENFWSRDFVCSNLNVRCNIVINTIELLQLVTKTGTSREKWWGIRWVVWLLWHSLIQWKCGPSIVSFNSRTGDRSNQVNADPGVTLTLYASDDLAQQTEVFLITES